MLRQRQSHISFNALADVAPAGIWRTRPNGECVYVNKAWKEMAGLQDGQWEGHGWSDAIHPEDREEALANWISAISNGTEFRQEMRWLRPDGSALWIMALGTPEYGENDEIVAYVGLNIDIQHNKELAEDLETQRERAEQAAAAKTSFLANMSHEIRTPMNGVVGFTELLLETDLDDEQRGHVQLIADSGRALMRLLNDILDVAKIEAGQLRIVNEPADIRSKLRHCIKLLEPMARAKGLNLGVWVDDAVPEHIEIDRLRLRQVILNLIGNAVKFTETGGIDVEARVENSSGGRYLLISVIDTGIGIEQDKLESIFTPFTQEDDSIGRRYGGTGLGLAISSQLIDMMGGGITVHSKTGVGTNFTIRLPLAESKRAEAKVPANDTAPATLSRLHGRRVLIAEDHSINQQLILAMATSLGLDAQLAEDGEEAVAAVIEAAENREAFDAVLMDMQMPGMDGLEATKRLRTLGYEASELPIIALTANCFPDDIEACRKAGMQSHIGKPVTQIALARELARFLPEPEVDEETVYKTAASRLGAQGNATSMEQLQQRYRHRKDELFEALRDTLQGDPETTDWDMILSDLHKLAGVAANFGDGDLGEISRRLERRLKITPEPHLRLAALQREWPQFEDAA